MKLNLKSKKCLIIEDHATMRKAIREMLYSMDAETISEASNGLNAISAMEKEKFDIVLCDYNLGPGKNGQQVLEEARFRKLLPYNAIFVMVTAEQHFSKVLGVMECKPDEYITKPFNAQQLAVRLQRNQERRDYLTEIERVLDLGFLSPAIRLCEQKLSQGDRRMRSHLLKLRAELAIDVGDFDKASAIYHEVLAQRDVYWARLGLGMVAFFRNQYEQALPIFRQLIDEQPMQLEAYDWLIKIYEARGDYASARQMLQKAVELSPQAILRQQKLAAVADKTEQLDVAEQAYKNAVALGKYSVHKSSGDYAGLARVYAKNDFNQAALTTLKEMRQTFINNSEAELRAALLESEIYRQTEEQGLSDIAFATAKQLCRDDSTIPKVLRLDFARICYLMGDVELGDSQVELLLRNNIDDERFITEIRNMLMQVDQAGQSESLIRHIKQELVGINNKGIDLYKRGQLSDAANVFEEAIKTMPENKTLLINLAKTLLHDMKKSGFETQKYHRVRALIAKAKILGVNRDKIGHLQLQLENLSASS
ncbi:MAG: response regulator [Gammaproteobacteria bacterium]